MQTLYITHPACHLHEMGDWHPECPQRLDAINDQLLSSGIDGLLLHEQSTDATDADILRVHATDYWSFLKRSVPESGYFEIDPDTLMNPHTLDAARKAAGAGILAVDSIMAGHAQNAFCAVRPPGHHARPSLAMGFCFVNNIAVAAAYALEKYGFERISIIDFDVHHGNGTAEMFAGDERVLMCGFFQESIFPNVHTQNQPKNMLNIPVEAYASGEQVRKLVEDRWMTDLFEFEPQFVFVSAGFDAHREDELAQLGLVEADYAWITQQIVSVAEHSAQGRIVSFLEGGYSLSALGRSVVAHLKVLAKL
ncbi:histone deacetylase family protein [Pusillimonas minor]|uniref:Histone deacetylase family protein n=1 Tax=Pusillimonas minor TaxID=2697024 RepID=A0A842HJH1_9BURK|nr:histone deacetylase family protein [Pusillimonas minor]MBC2768416.1 histone deacetylase family protein [Pusillimonas minor]